MKEFILKLLKLPQAVFIYNMIFNWYVLIMVPTLYVTYYFFKGLAENDKIQAIAQFIISKFMISIEIAKDCTPLITDLPNLFRCIAAH